jgi:hypothetical protein
MTHTPNETKQGQRMTTKTIFREEIRPSDFFGKHIFAETTWHFCVGA